MDTDVVVIGAGAAGLACATNLVRAGKKVIVLEARNRLGGRVHTVRDEHGLIEAGAELIHGENATTWEIINANHLATEEWAYNSDTSYRAFAKGGKIRSDGEELLVAMRETEKGLYDYHGPEINIATYLKRQAVSTEALFFSKRHIGDYEGADVENISALLVAEECAHATSGPRNFWVADGYDNIIKALARGLDIRTNCPVTGVVWNEQEVCASTADGEVRGKRLVITVPIGVLRSGAISFTPALPENFTLALNKVGYGNNTKIALWIEGPIEFYRLIATEGMVGHFWMHVGKQQSLLTGFCGGSRADELARMSEEEAIELAKEEICSAYGSDFKKRIVAGHRFAWLDDPYALGSYSYSALGQGDAREELRKPIASNIFYTGEATNNHGHIATVHGAIEAGLDTATHLLTL